MRARTPGEVIRDKRKNKSLTLENVAKVLGTTLTWLQRREAGATAMTLQDVRVLRGVLGLSVEETQEMIDGAL